jgi:hypothetical protein
MYTTNEPISFEYKWLDDIIYTVNIPAGSYRVDDVNSILQQTMATNRHYIVSLISNISISIGEVYIIGFLMQTIGLLWMTRK